MKKSGFVQLLKVMLVVIFITTGCAGGPSYEMDKEYPGIDRITGATVEIVSGQKVLQNVGPFNTVIIRPFDVPSKLRTDYPYEIDQFQNTFIGHLRGRNKFDVVQKSADGPRYDKGFNVEGEILDLRIASPAARVWGGALAGSSYMDLYLKLVDNQGNVIDEKIIGTHNNALGAAWSGGASDRTLPTDMAAILAEYILTVVPSE